MLFLWIGIISTLENKLPATFGTRFGVTGDVDRSLMRLETVVIAGWNSSFILFIALFRLVPCCESTMGCIACVVVHSCFIFFSAAERRSIGSVFGSLLFVGQKSTRLSSCVPFVAVT